MVAAGRAIPSTGNYVYLQSPPNGGWQLTTSDAHRYWVTTGMPSWVSRFTRGWYRAAYGAVASPTKAALDVEG